MTDAEIVHRILLLGILEMRACAAENQAAYAMGSFLHRIPERLNNVAANKETYADLLDDLARIAEIYGCNGWLQSHLQQIEVRGTKSN